MSELLVMAIWPLSFAYVLYLAWGDMERYPHVWDDWRRSRLLAKIVDCLLVFAISPGFVFILVLYRFFASFGGRR